MPDHDAEIRDLLGRIRTIAVVGWSPKADRPSHGVARFLADRGYTVIPVNPGQAGQAALGTTVRASLDEVEMPIDMVDIFRRSDEAGAVVDAALAAFPHLQAVWMQLGVVDAAAAGRAGARGVMAVMDRCPAIEIARLFSPGWRR
jgi:hypothetical protein